MVVFGVVPVVYAISLSLSTASKQHVWQNYYSAFTDFRFDSTVTDVATYLGLWLPSLLVVVFLAAFLLDARLGRISTALRIIFYLPASLAGTASVLLWVFMLDPTISPFKPLWHLFGVKSILQVVTPGNTGLIVATIALSLGAGGWIVIVFGALQSLPEEIMSAAKMDGCGGFRIVRYIKLPLLYRYAWLMMILSFATGTQVFVEPTILADTNSGFVNPTWSINQLSYLYAFTYGRFGVSAAISSSLFVLSLLIAIIVVFRTKFYAIEGR
jgi:multiple sugar transport system permease protein